MSMLEQLQELERQKFELLLELKDAKSNLDNCTSSIKSFYDSIAYLETRTSKTAKELHDSYCTELQKAEKKQKVFLRKIRSLEGKISDIDIIISNLNFETSDPIYMQITRLVDDFFKYVGNNFQKIAKQFRQTYRVQVIIFKSIGSVHIQIYDENTLFVFARNEEIKEGIRYKEVNKKVESYLIVDYFKKIYPLLKTKLIERNPFKDTFSISVNDFKFSFYREEYERSFQIIKFDDSDFTFTLELV